MDSNQVTPFSVEGQVDFGKLIERFGASPLDGELLQRFQVVTGQPLHPFLRRGIVISHRDLDKLLDHHQAGRPIYIYTGRGPSSASIHLGHYIPLSFTKYLQDVFQAKVVIQLTNDEKFLFKDLDLGEVEQMTGENIKDIMAIGFDPERTFIFDNLSYIGQLYPNVLRIQKCLTINKIQGCFGFNNSDNVGKHAFPAIQMAPCFPSSFPNFLEPGPPTSHRPEGRDWLCLVPQAIDQDNYFRLVRDLCPSLGIRKPVCLHTAFLPSLTGEAKMSSSTETKALFMDASEEVIREAVNRAVSGGQVNKKLQQELGADLDKDMIYQYLQIFLEDEEEMEEIRCRYGPGPIDGPRMMTSQVKTRLLDILLPLFKQFQARRSELN